MAKRINFKIMFAAFLFLLYLPHPAFSQQFSVSRGNLYEREESKEIKFLQYDGAYNLCESDRKTIPILIANQDSNKGKSFSFQIDSPEWIHISASNFSLGVKQSAAALLELNPKKGDKGKYKVNFRAFSSNDNLFKDLFLDVVVDECYSVEVRLGTYEDKLCGLDAKNYEIEFIDKGKNQTDFDVRVNGPEWVSQRRISDFKSELIVNVPSNTKGSFDVVVSSAIQNQASDEKKLTLDISSEYDCYRAQIEFDGNMQNYYSNEIIPIKVRNIGMRQANYSIGYKGPEWIRIISRELGISPQQTSNLNLNISPNSDIPEGTYHLTISLIKDKEVYSKNIKLELHKKRDFFRKFTYSFFSYQYFIYFGLAILLGLFFLARFAARNIRNLHGKYKLRKTRIVALAKARQAKALKKDIKNKSR